jgi:uncharacterized membrane protein
VPRRAPPVGVRSAAVLALTVDSAKNIAIGIALALVIIAFLVAKFVSSVTTKALVILILGGAVLGVWTQRASLADCAEDVTTKMQQGDFSATQCTFFGVKIDVDVPGE